jgi:ribosomal protein S18 acetylase RimI-like enzyme
MKDMSVNRAGQEDRPWVLETIEREWHGPLIERADEFVDARDLEADIAYQDGERVGLSTLLITNTFIEVVTLNSFRQGQGIGTALLNFAETTARQLGLEDVRLFTTNDNLHALGFYQKRGFRLWKIHRDTMTRARKVKPEIPLIGRSGILVADEIELRLTLH